MARTSYFNLQFPLQADSGCILQPIYPEWHAEKPEIKSPSCSSASFICPGSPEASAPANILPGGREAMQLRFTQLVRSGCWRSTDVWKAFVLYPHVCLCACMHFTTATCQLSPVSVCACVCLSPTANVVHWRGCLCLTGDWVFLCISLASLCVRWVDQCASTGHWQSTLCRVTASNIEKWWPN